MTRRRPIRHWTAAAGLALVSVLAGACASVDTSNLDPVKVPDITTTTAAATTPTDGCGGLLPTVSYDPQPAWLGAPGEAARVPSGTKLAEIKDRGKLRVGVSADTLLFGSANPLTGQIEGFDIDMLASVAAAIWGISKDAGDPHAEAVARLEFKVITYAQRIPSLRDGSVDLVAHTMTINCPRWSQVAFSTVYYQAGQKVLIRRAERGAPEGPRTITDLAAAGAKVCAPAGSTNIDELKKYDGVQVTEVDDITDCLVLFQQGRVAAITADDTVLAGFARQDPYAVLSGDAFTSEPYGIAAALDHPDLIQFVNAVLDRDRADGTWERIATTWLGADDQRRPPVPETGRPLP